MRGQRRLSPTEKILRLFEGTQEAMRCEMQKDIASGHDICQALFSDWLVLDYLIKHCEGMRAHDIRKILYGDKLLIDYLIKAIDDELIR